MGSFTPRQAPRAQRQISWWPLTFETSTGFWDTWTKDTHKAVIYDSSASQLYHGSATRPIDHFIGQHELGTEWSVEVGKCAPQADKHDCGVFTLVNAVHIVTGMELPTETHGDLWRKVLPFLLGKEPMGDSFPEGKDLVHVVDFGTMEVIVSYHLTSQIVEQTLEP